MLIVRFLTNLLIFAVEVAAVAGVAWLGYRQPLALAGVAAALVLIFGVTLDRARLTHELGFYFDRAAPKLSLAGSLLAISGTVLKAILAGVVTVITFSGTDHHRLYLIAIVFGLCVFGGSSLLRGLSMRLGLDAMRWGYFRLAAPLGVLYSAILYLMTMTTALPAPSLAEIGRRLFLDTPQQPSLEQASELMFLLKQKFDETATSVLSHLLPPDWAQVAGILVSVNMLTGFALAVFAVTIAAVVHYLEDATS